MASRFPLLASSTDTGSKGPPHQQSPPHANWSTNNTRPVSSYSTGSYGWDKKPSRQPPTEEDKGAPCDQANESGDPTLIAKSACLRCRGKKSRCSGERPTCQTCRNSGLDRIWDAHAPEFSSQPVKRKTRSSADTSKQGPSKRKRGPHCKFGAPARGAKNEKRNVQASDRHTSVASTGTWTACTRSKTAGPEPKT